MTIDLNTKPWMDDLDASEQLREFVSFARADGPSAADLQCLGDKLSPLVGATLIGPVTISRSLAPSQPSAGAGASAGKAALWKALTGGVAKVVVATVAVGLGAFLWLGRPPMTAIEPKALPPQPVATPSVAASPGEQSVPALAPVIEQKLPAKARSTPRAKVEPTPAVAPPPVSEVTLIQQAQGLRSQPAALLARLEEHARLYPNGMFAQEREVLAVEALVALGRRSEAEQRAKGLEAAHPGSAHLRRVRVLLGTPAQQ